MLVILDQCNIGLAREPNGGFVLKMTDNEGMPPELALLLPVETKDVAYQLVDGIVEILGPRVHVSDLQSMKKETQNAGLETPHQ